MAENSKIEWTDHTFNPWIGCTKVSPGCLNCYAETLMDTRYKRVKWGAGNPRQRTSKSNWKLPIRWSDEPMIWNGSKHRRPRIFCASLADWLDDEVPIEWLADLLKLIHDTPNLDWLLLTKRPENWRNRICAAMAFVDKDTPKATPEEEAEILGYLARKEPAPQPRWGELISKLKRNPVALWLGAWLGNKAPSNIWLGTSVEDQKRADERIPELLKIPAKVRFLSCEPLLRPVDLEKLDVDEICPECKQRITASAFSASAHCECCVEGDEPICWNPLHWVIVGGESGPGKRPMKLEWARSLRDQCKAADVAFFMKQIDKVQPIPDDLMIRQFPKGTQ